MYTDSISDMLTRIRNGLGARKPQVVMPHSKMKEALARLLVAEGFIAGVEVLAGRVKMLQIDLKYDNNQPIISSLVRVSTPGQRIYAPAERIPRSGSGFGVTIISTSKGLMSDREARKLRLGGEVICQIW